MVDAFFYMYFVGAGTAAGAATIVFIGWKVVQRSNKKQITNKRKGAFK